MSSSLSFFPYSWHVKDDEVHVYGFDAAGDVALVRLLEFTPYVYIKLPLSIDWTPTSVSRLVTAIKKKTSSAKIVKTAVMYKRPLYFVHAHWEPNGTVRYDTCPYLFVAFASERDRRQFAYCVPRAPHTLSVLGVGTLALEIYEHNATPVLQLTCLRGISTADWFQVRHAKPADEPVSRLANEYAVSWKAVSPPGTDAPQGIPQPLILSYDIECNFHDPNKFSDGSHPNDIVFQISCVLGRQSQPKSSWTRYLLTLGNPDPAFLGDVVVRTYKKEFQLLMGFCALVVETNPQILIGYNIFKFDIPFLFKRATEQRIHDDFVRHGCTRDKCTLETIRWSSSAYSNQEMNFLDLQGRMTIDLLTLIQRDFNLENYKLDTVAEKFLGSGKDPLNHHDIFMCYQMGMEQSRDGGVSQALGVVGKYCVKDSELVLELFEKFQYWYSLTEMAKICQVPHSHLFLYGQQLKVFSQVYKYCFKENIVVESGRFKPNEDDFCAGAYVFTPEPGLYDNVVSFDFQSLYPSIIISHNIDFTTLVAPDDVSRVPSEQLNRIAWGEHVNCACRHAEHTKDKDVRCKDYTFHWLKEPRGVLPTIIQNLLDARKAVRQQMKTLDPKSLGYDILNKRQLAYKVSSNSMYGALSTKKGYLPFLPAGMCVTAIGRQSIERVSELIQHDHQGKIVYGDSVTGDTPVLVRDPATGWVDVRAIAELVDDAAYEPYPTFRMFDLWHVHLDKQYARTPLEVWSDQGWTPIRKVIRHRTQKRLFTVGSARGVVCVTEDHSLLTADRVKIRPTDVRRTTRLLYAFPRDRAPQIEETPSTLDAAYRSGVFCPSRIPSEWFRASHSATERFLRGFKSEQFYPRFRFTDAVLAQHMYLLLTRVGRQVWVDTHTTENGDVVYELVERSEAPSTYTTVWYEHPRPATFQTYVYDLETACGRFQAGVGQMIVKNTDSNYVMFPHLDSLQAIWEHSVHVSNAVSSCFPPPMRLEFEEHIYARYLILSKKRYLYLSCTPDGVVSSKIEHKGVLLKRRDNSAVVRDVYEQLIRMVLDRRPETDVLTRLLFNVSQLCLRVPDPDAYRISKSVKGITGFTAKYRDSKTIQYGDYVVPCLKPTLEARAKQLDEKGIVHDTQWSTHFTDDGPTEVLVTNPEAIDAFYQSHLPGAVQLALRMRARGQHIESGSRLSYLITRRAPHSASVTDRMEEIEYFQRNYSKQMIDTLHYLYLLINPVEEVLSVIYGKKYTQFVKQMYKYRIKYDAVVDQLYRLFHPIELIDAVGEYTK